MKRNTVLLLASLAGAVLLLLIALLLTGRPGAEDTAGTTAGTTIPVNRDGMLVGVCMPDQTEAWINAGYQLKNQLESVGYQVNLTCSDGTVERQRALITDLMSIPVDCLVVTPVDSTALTEVAQTAQEKQIPIVSYGSLVMAAEGVSGYVCYDYFGMGAAIAQQVETQFSLATAAAESRSYTFELFMGAAWDSNAISLYNGIYSVLDPYIRSGVLQSRSGRLAFEDSCIPGWSEDAAQQSCATRLKHSYGGAAPDICITASDAIAAGVIRVLEVAHGTQEHWPFVTGNGATETGMANLESGKQALTVRTDPTQPAEACVAMVDRALFGAEPDFPVSRIFNNVVSVPTALCGFELVDPVSE